MKRILALICIICMLAGLMVIAGCSSSGSSEVKADKSIVEGIKSNFLDISGNLVAFTQFGTFKLVVDDQLAEGDYSIINTEDGHTIEMAFENGEKETWSIVVTEGEVTSVIDDEGTEYTEQDHIELDRTEEI